MSVILAASGLIAVAALFWSAYGTYYVMRRDPGDERMRTIQGFIREGAWAFMLAEAKVMAVTLVIIGAILWALFYWEVAVAFWIGSGLSMAAGFIGMNAATLANARTTHAVRRSIREALTVAFTGGSVMGIAVAGLATAGLVFVIWLFRREFDPNVVQITTKTVFGIPGADVNFIKGALIVSAYSAGASLVALFDRVGGGIYTKAADMAADLVGKVELKIPEDDPRNPAAIADNVGDNVGDVGGLGADLLESFVSSIIAVIVICLYMYVGRFNPDIQALLAKYGFTDPSLVEQNYWWFVLLPILYVAGGIAASLLAVMYIRYSRRTKDMQRILMNGFTLAAFLTAGFAALTTALSPLNFVPFISLLLGIVSGVLIGFISEYYTSARYRPTRELARMYQSGPAVGVTEGMAVGMSSSLLVCLVIAAAIIVAYQLGGLLAVAYAGMGMLTFVGIMVSMDSYGPIGDNAAGIATMAKLEPHVREQCDILDSIGNTTAAIGKGFAIGSAAFAAIGLIAAYLWSAAGRAAEVHLPNVPLVSPEVGGLVMAGLITGAMLTYVFSAMLIRAVSRTADVMVQEIRRQFRENPKLMTGEAVPDYRRCITITAHNGVRRMVVPSLLAVVLPLFIGLVFGRYTLAGFLVGALLSAIMLAIFCGNAGGAMDNAKKYVEEGHFGGKGSEAHAAGVVADTVGDPLKDTVGPSLDILIKLMSVISLLFASLFPVQPIFLR